MIFIYLILSIIIFIVAYKLFTLNELSFEFYLFWTFIGACLFITVIYPDLLHFLRNLFYYGNKKGNFVFIIAIIILFMLNMKLSITSREVKKKQEILTQKQAMKNFLSENSGKEVVKNTVLAKMSVYNEEMNLGDVLKEMPDNIDILVIDDGSTDSTVQVAKSFDVHVIEHSINLGQGAADITGFRYAKYYGYEIVVEMDGDGQHDPKDIPAFVEALKTSESDIITGSRILGSSHSDNSALRRFFLPYYTKLLNSLTDYNLTDSMCGMKAFKMSKLNNDFDIFNKVTESQYLASELYIRFSHRGYKISEIPICINRRTTGVSRKGIFRYGLRVLWSMVRVWMIKKILLRQHKSRKQSKNVSETR